MNELLHGEEECVYGDSGYIGAKKRPDAVRKNKSGNNIRYIINRRPSSIKNYPKTVSMPLRKENIRNHLSAVKLNTSSE